MTRTYKSFIIFFASIILILLFFLKKYNDKVSQEQIDILVSKKTELIMNELSYQKKYALSQAILLSKNQNIINYLKANKPLKMKEELNNLISMISNYTKLDNIQVQVHTKDLKVFLRTWEDKDIGLNLKSFRQGLVKVKQTKQPFVSNELGKRFNIKAISPIIENNEYLGSLEVIIDYSSLKQRLKTMGITILPLIDNKYLEIAKYLKNNKKIYNYVLIEKNYNQNLFDILLHNPKIFSFEKFYYKIDDKIVTLIPIGNIKEKDIAYIVASFNNSNEEFNYLPMYKYNGEISQEIFWEYKTTTSSKNPITIK